MKLKRILSLIFGMAVAISCSKDDDAEPSLEKVTLSLSADSQVIEVPTAMQTSEDPYAAQAVAWVSMANAFSGNLALFTPPSGATKSSDIITPVNGRVASTGKAVVYIWTDQQYGSVAYQIRDATDKYTFELFYKGNSDTGWYRYLYAEELKDRSEGYMVLYDAWGFMSETRDEPMTRWDWSRQGDVFTFEISDFDFGFRFVITVNTKTKAGSLVYYEDSEKLTEITWDAQGKGTWKEYESNQVVDEGTWG
jgi:hypothetical protein